MIFALLGSLLLVQLSPNTLPSPAMAPTPAPTATPVSAIGPSLGSNDPCTSLSAIVSRPTVTNSVCTVRPNHYEIEAGYQNTSVDGAGTTVVYPQTLIRVGTAVPGLEVQVVPPDFERSSVGGAISTGVADSGFGLKYVLGYTPKLVYGIQINATAPTGTGAFSAGSTETLYAAQASYTLSPVFSLTAGASDQILVSGGNYYGSFVPSVELTASLPNGMSVFGEVAQFTRALGPRSPTRTQYLVGIARDIGQRLQVDLEGGYSPTVASGKYRYIGAGFGYYF